jgi:hypothetical protein
VLLLLAPPPLRPPLGLRRSQLLLRGGELAVVEQALARVVVHGGDHRLAASNRIIPHRTSPTIPTIWRVATASRRRWRVR